MAHLHHQPCHVVYTDYRPTPLQHYIYPAGGDGLHLVVDEQGNFREENFNTAMSSLLSVGDASKGKLYAHLCHHQNKLNISISNSWLMFSITNFPYSFLFVVYSERNICVFISPMSWLRLTLRIAKITGILLLMHSPVFEGIHTFMWVVAGKATYIDIYSNMTYLYWK